MGREYFSYFSGSLLIVLLPYSRTSYSFQTKIQNSEACDPSLHPFLANPPPILSQTSFQLLHTSYLFSAPCERAFLAPCVFFFACIGSLTLPALLELILLILILHIHFQQAFLWRRCLPHLSTSTSSFPFLALLLQNCVCLIFFSFLCMYLAQSLVAQ